MEKVKRARHYRHLAADKLRVQGFSSSAALITLVFILLFGISSSTIIGVIILGGAFLLGIAYVTAETSKGKKPYLADMFEGFKNFGNSILLFVVSRLFIFFWSLLLIIPGIIKTYSYSMIYFIQNENPDMRYDDVITESRNLVRGYKWKLFCLDLSYIGWYILVGLTFGILSLWVVPKHMLARYEFYLDLKGKEEVKVEIVEPVVFDAE